MAESHETPPETAANSPRKRPPLKAKGCISAKTARALDLAVNYDVPPKIAYQTVIQPTKMPNASTFSRFSKKVQAWRIESPKAQKIAHKTLKTFAAGLAVGDVSPNSSTVLQAATRIIDAVSPVTKRVESLTINATIDPVTLADYLVER